MLFQKFVQYLEEKVHIVLIVVEISSHCILCNSSRGGTLRSLLWRLFTSGAGCMRRHIDSPSPRPRLTSKPTPTPTPTPTTCCVRQHIDSPSPRPRLLIHHHQDQESSGDFSLRKVYEARHYVIHRHHSPFKKKTNIIIITNHLLYSANLMGCACSI